MQPHGTWNLSTPPSMIYHPSPSRKPAQILRDCIPDFFKPHDSDSLSSGPLAACSRRPARVDFIHAPFFRWQADVRNVHSVPALLFSRGSSGLSLTVLLPAISE